eukprot:Tbor_TRINITY_DN5010_c7_g1::TRINITY_DN5010_c7_g1_i1::g.14129::m.14129/K01921/ddl; D-alanine-D-alanine ligase
MSVLPPCNEPPCSKKSPIRVCVLTSSYEGSDSELKEYEGSVSMNPSYYFSEENDKDMYTFELHPIRKATSYRQIRDLVASDAFDVFFNLCDGAKDEDRAGEDVVTALEEFKPPFTASISKFYELSKPDMKMMAHYANIPTAQYAVLDCHITPSIIRESCKHMRFPVIVKHISGYSSVGMTKDCKCLNFDELIPRVERFVDEYKFALVEEFISGDEVTVLACADRNSKDGVRVYHPVQVNFPPGDDFKHFQLKWESFDGMTWMQVPQDDPALEQMIDMTRSCFLEMMGGIGYGRCDFRVDRVNNKVVFLEINPNCGVMYPPGQEGSADWILRLTGAEAHKEFATLQIDEAIARNVAEKPKYRRCFDSKFKFHLRACCDIPKGSIIFRDEGRPFRLYTLPYIANNWTKKEIDYFKESSWPVGEGQHYYAVWDLEPANWRSFNHSCDPNMEFDVMRSLNVIALRDIAKDEEMTMDYRRFMDSQMTPFYCHCGATNCEGYIEIPISDKARDKGISVVIDGIHECNKQIISHYGTPMKNISINGNVANGHQV